MMGYHPSRVWPQHLTIKSWRMCCSNMSIQLKSLHHQVVNWCLLQSLYFILCCTDAICATIMLIVYRYRKVDSSWRSWKLDVVLEISCFLFLVKWTTSYFMHVIFRLVLFSLWKLVILVCYCFDDNVNITNRIRNIVLSSGLAFVLSYQNVTLLCWLL